MANSRDIRSARSQASRSMAIRRTTTAEPPRSQDGAESPAQSSAASTPATSGCTVPSTCPNRLRIGRPGPSCGSRKPRCTHRTRASPATPASSRRWAWATVVGLVAQIWRNRSPPLHLSSRRSIVRGGSGASQPGASAPAAATTAGPTPTVTVSCAVTAASSGSRSVSGARPAIKRSMSSVHTVRSRRTESASAPRSRSRATKVAYAGGPSRMPAWCAPRNARAGDVATVAAAGVEVAPAAGSTADLVQPATVVTAAPATRPAPASPERRSVRRSETAARSSWGELTTPTVSGRRTPVPPGRRAPEPSGTRRRHWSSGSPWCSRRSRGTP